MKAGFVSALLVASMLCMVAVPALRAEDGDKPAAGEKGKHNPVEALLKHATDLKLTDDQITKLKALQSQQPGKELKDAIMAILTDDQKTAWAQIREKHKGGGKDKPAN